MNQRESTGLPLRAIVMVLLFLGVVFLLVAFQALYSGDDDDTDSAETTASSTITPTPTSSGAAESSEPAEPDKPDVRVFNVSEVAGAAENVANRLREQQWNVTETGNLVLEGVTETTVYYGDTPGEREGAEEIGKTLEAPVAVRVPGLAEQPPGVIVVVTG